MIEDLILNATGLPVAIDSAILTRLDTIAGRFFFDGLPYFYEIDSEKVLYQPDEVRIDAKAKCKTGVPCGDVCLPRGSRCRKGLMTPSAKGGVGIVKKAIAAGLIAGTVGVGVANREKIATKTSNAIDKSKRYATGKIVRRRFGEKTGLSTQGKLGDAIEKAASSKGKVGLASQELVKEDIKKGAKKQLDKLKGKKQRRREQLGNAVTAATVAGGAATLSGAAILAKRKKNEDIENKARDLEIEQELERMKEHRRRKDTRFDRKPKCKTGSPCGDICLPRGSKCRKGIPEPSAKGKASGVKLALAAGAVGTAVGLGAIAANSKKVAPAVQAKPPEVPTAPTQKTKISGKQATAAIAGSALIGGGAIALKEVSIQKKETAQATQEAERFFENWNVDKNSESFKNHKKEHIAQRKSELRRQRRKAGIAS